MELILPDGHDCPRCGSWHAIVTSRHRLLRVNWNHGWRAWSLHVRRRRMITDAFLCATCSHLFDGATHAALEHRLACLREIAA